MIYAVKVKIRNKRSSTTAVLEVEAKDKDDAQSKVFQLLSNTEELNRVLEIKNVVQKEEPKNSNQLDLEDVIKEVEQTNIK